MEERDLKRSVAADGPSSQLLEKLNEKISAAQESCGELDAIPLVATWAANEQEADDPGREASTEPPASERVGARMRKRQAFSRRKAGALMVAALLALAVIGVCTSRFEGSGAFGTQETLKNGVAAQDDTFSESSGASSVAAEESSASWEVVGTMEVGAVHLVSSGENAVLLEATVVVDLPAYAGSSVSLSVEYGDGAEGVSGTEETVAHGIGGPFTIRCPAPASLDVGNDDLAPARLHALFVQAMRKCVLAVSGPEVDEKVRIGIDEGDERVDDLVAKVDEGSVMVLDLVLCQ